MNRYALAIALASACVLASGFVWWDIAWEPPAAKTQRPSDTGVNSYRTRNGEPRSHLDRFEARPRSPSSAASSVAEEADPASMQVNSGSTDDRRARAQRRAERKSATLSAFFTSQPRDAWASQTEIELRQSKKAEGIAFEEVECRTGVCRIVAAGSDKMEVLESIMSTSSASGMKSFARVISNSDGTAKVEGFVSPGDVKWPRPSFDDG